MSKFRPLHLVSWTVAGVGLPLLCAVFITDPGFRADVVERARQALGANDLTKWADVDLEGRVATLKGKTTNPEAPDAAARVVAATDGVRKVVNTATVEPLGFAPPSIESVSTAGPLSEVHGTWPDDVAKKLTVTLGAGSYTFPGNAELSSAGGKWSLRLAEPLAPGSYDVMATASVESDGAIVIRAADAPGRIVIAPSAAQAEPAQTEVPASAPTVAAEPVVQVGDTPEPQASSETAGPSAAEAPVSDAGETSNKTTPTEAAAAATSSATVQATSGGETPAAVQAAEPQQIAPAKGEPLETAGASASTASGAEPTQDANPEPAADVGQATVTPAAAWGPAPTVERQLDLTGAPVILGTWPEGEDVALSVMLAGRTYDLGTSANLSRRGVGKWKLLPSAALKDGIYDVVVIARRGAEEMKDQSIAEIEVDATLPKPPTVNIHASDTSPETLTGTFDAQHTATLRVRIAEVAVVAELGTPGSPLTTDGDGNWTLAVPQRLSPGTYNVVVSSTDKRGRSVDDASAGEIIISAPTEAAPKTDASFSCVVTMQRISAVFPMRFLFDKIDFQERFGLSVSQYAALLKDSRCKTINVEVGGHADERGSDWYNEDLAERRAARVRDMLVEAGVASPRLSVASYGESVPLNPGHDEAAWSVNRRVEIKIEK